MRCAISYKSNITGMDNLASPPISEVSVHNSCYESIFCEAYVRATKIKMDTHMVAQVKSRNEGKGLKNVSRRRLNILTRCMIP